MFDFTKEVILNSIAGIKAITNATDPFVPVGDAALDIPRANKYLASGIPDGVIKASGYAAVKEVGTITLPTGQTAGNYRLELDITTSGSYAAEYDRWAIDKGKPIYVEFAIAATQATADNFATAALPLIQRGLKKANGNVTSDIVVTKGTGTLILTAKNEYLRFSNVKITKLDVATQQYLPIGTTYATTTAGKEGFGTAWTLTKNVRIPTQEATRFMGENQDETPIVGSIYNQYTFQYEQKRNFTGLDAVGAKLESRTTHVFWVLNSLSTAFEDIITDVLGDDSIFDNITGASVNPA